MKNFYEILKVSTDAPPEVIAAGYRALAKKVHPDLQGNSEAAKRAQQQINEAYETLRSPVRRAKYDAFLNGHDDLSGRASAPSTAELKEREKDVWFGFPRAFLYTSIVVGVTVASFAMVAAIGGLWRWADAHYGEDSNYSDSKDYSGYKSILEVDKPPAVNLDAERRVPSQPARLEQGVNQSPSLNELKPAQSSGLPRVDSAESLTDEELKNELAARRRKVEMQLRAAQEELRSLMNGRGQ